MVERSTRLFDMRSRVEARTMRFLTGSSRATTGGTAGAGAGDALGHAIEDEF